MRDIRMIFVYVFPVRWSLIAGRIPGRTAEEIEKYWTSRYSNSRWGMWKEASNLWCVLLYVSIPCTL